MCRSIYLYSGLKSIFDLNGLMGVIMAKHLNIFWMEFKDTSEGKISQENINLKMI